MYRSFASEGAIGKNVVKCSCVALMITVDELHWKAFPNKEK